MLAPERVLVREGFAPVGHDEVRILSLGRLKRRSSIGVLEVVQLQQSLQEDFVGGA